MKEKIGIFGGSFNPLHKGHIKMANLAIEKLKLDRLYIIPVGNPCHKATKNFVDGIHRINMIKLAFQNNPKAYPCDLEIKSERLSYTYETLLEIKSKHPNAIIYTIIGEDSAEYLHKWRNYDKMKELCEFVYFKRKGYKSHPLDLLHIDAPLFNVSSTMIREKISKNKPLGEYLTPEVEEYIKINKLYK